MRNTVKKVTFDVPFRYSYAGGFHECTAVFVVEPNFTYRTVHRKMQGFVGEAVRALMAERPKNEKSKDTTSNIEQSDEVAPEQKPEDTAPVEEDVDASAAQAIGVMQAYLSAERYGEFAEFAQRSLTASAALCYIETEDGKKVSVRDETWDSIVANGGMADLDRVIGAFTSFFTDPPETSRKKNGSGSPSTPGAIPKEGSQPTRH